MFKSQNILAKEADLPTKHSHHIVVDLLVKQVASEVFQGVLDADYSENYQQRNHGDFLLKGFNHWHPVQ